MKKIFIKCIFPHNYYLARNVRIRKSSGEAFTIGHRQKISLELNNEGWLDFKLDYHKSRLILDGLSNQNDLYITVTLKCRNTFPFIYTDVMFRNAMEVKVVSQEEFQSFEDAFNQQAPKVKRYNIADYIAIALATLVSLGYVALAVVNENLNERNFLFVVGSLGVIASLRLLFRRKKISENHYFSVIQSLPIVSFVLLILINFSGKIKVAFLMVSLAQYLIAAINRNLSSIA